MSKPDKHDLIDALRLVPLFYTINWTPEKKAEWLRITGSTEATTKVLCDHVRSAIVLAEERKLVPIEPTEEMLRAALEDYLDYERQGPRKRPWNGRTMWRAMLSAVKG